VLTEPNSSSPAPNYIKSKATAMPKSSPAIPQAKTTATKNHPKLYLHNG